VARTSRKSLRLLGSVGEPINPEAWEWYHRVVGDGRCPIVDTWWQTETGACLMTPLPGAHALKPGSCAQPLPGVKPQLVDAEGKVLDGAISGNLCLTDSWPGQMRTVYGDHQRFIDTYFSTYPGKYFTGDGARRDADGYFWITGRVDDVINVSGHRLGTAEIESALVSHPAVAEAAVVGYPHDIKGQGIYCYVTLKVGVDATEALTADLRGHVRREIGPFAAPDVIQFAPGLPKTRSGKIMRRILRKIAEDDLGNLGDTSTLADPAVVDDLVANRAGRGDDEAFVAGKRLSCAELEAKLGEHNAVAEAAVVAVPGGQEGDALWAFVTQDPEILPSDVLGADIKGYLRREVGPHAVPVAVLFGPLPKTASGEVVRPVLRRIAETGDPGDVSGLADAGIAAHFVRARTEALA
ncbi:MAG: AMP-binding enzyme, partial [Phenylobacterium sp.]